MKLSAIHPRFDPGKEERLDRELLPRLVELAAAARRQGLGLTVDAEEQDRLDLTLGLFAGAFCDPALDGWPGLGLAVQAYGKRAIPVLRWLRRLAEHAAQAASRCGSSRAPTGTARSSGRRSAGSPTIPCSRARCTPTCPISPACGCCWPTGRRSFRSSPPTTRSPIACGLRRRPAAARSSSSACTAWARRSTRRWSAAASSSVPCRIYAPVGPHEDLVAYLVRRLLENGANTSFVNRLADEAAPIDGDHPRSRRERRAESGGGAPVRAAAAARDLLRPSASTAAAWR